MIYALIGIAAAFCACIQWGDEIPVPHGNVNKKEAKYEFKVAKQEEKEKFERKKLEKNPSGYMTVEEYNLLSAPKDRMTMEIEIPKNVTPADMVYVPQPAYKIVRYNNPPGSPEIRLSKTFYQRRQQNAQGIVAPDFTKLVYPSVYYYPNSGSTACDVFVINLEEAKSNLDKILTANVVHRFSEPILSTDKNNDNYFTFRTITPVDFSVDGSKLLAKEKIGNTKDGIWKTTPVVYDFTTNLSYSLIEVRDAIIYYWKENKNLDLEDKRWDIYPIGFDLNNPDWIIVNAYAFTGDTPVNLGTWTVSYKGEQSRLVTFKNSEVQVSMNGYKLIQDGVVSPMVTEKEEKQLKRIEKEQAKIKKKEEKAEDKALEDAYKAKIKEMEAEFKEMQDDYNLRQRINGSTSGNEAVQKYNEIKAQQEEARQKALEKQKAKELRELEKQRLKEERQNRNN
ncbi:unknown [Clostridium sp. CAG:967]|nr:unknown [Clostridium sp. CAG:967]